MVSNIANSSENFTTLISASHVMTLFYADNRDHVLEWHQRRAIAVGIAKGVRFLHEESRGCPIVHCDMRLSNIFLTCEFVPLVNI